MSALHKAWSRVSLRRLAVAAAAWAGLLTVAASPASAQIVTGQGIAGVRIGDSMSKVAKVLGTPDSSPYTSHGEWQYSSPQKLGGFVGFRAGTEGHEHLTSGVTYIQTSSREQRTAAGVSPGAAYSQFRRVYPGYRCDRMNGAGSGIRACWTKSRFHGQKVTTAFYFEGGPKVVFVVVAGQSYQLRAEFAL